MFTLEPFEPRRFLSATTFNVEAPLIVSVSHTGTLFVTGTNKADDISIRPSAGGIAVKLGKKIAANVSKAVKRVSVQGGAGRDKVRVDLKSSIPVKLVGGKGVDRLLFVARELAVTQGTASSGSADGGSSSASADGLQLVAPISGTTSDGFVSFGTGKVADVPTRADHTEITLGAHSVDEANDWFSTDFDVFAPGHDVRKIVRVEPDGSATSYVYSESSGKVTVSKTSTNGILWGSSTIPNGKGGWKTVKDTVYLEDFHGTQNWSPENSIPDPGSPGYIVDAIKGQAPDIFQIATGDGSNQLDLVDGKGGKVPAADVLASMLVNPKKVKGDVASIASGTKLSLADARAYFDASVASYLGAYTPTAKQPGHRVLLVEGGSAKQTQFQYNADGTVTVTQVTPSPIRLVDGVDTGNSTILATMFTKYEA